MKENSSVDIKTLVIVGIFIATGIVLSPLLVIPLGFAKAFPIQHMINVFIGVFFGVYYNVGSAFCLSTIRNLLGTGTLLAYPGSMFGAFLSAYAYKKTNSVLWACVGEVVGTGIIGGYVAYLIAAFVLGSKLGAMALIIPFSASSVCGAVMAGLAIGCMPKGIKNSLGFSNKVN